MATVYLADDVRHRRVQRARQRRAKWAGIVDLEHDKLRAALGDERATRMRTQGRGLAFDDAAADALRESVGKRV